MPKLLVGIISAAFAVVIGFACGALLTAPKNVQMENLINEKEALQKDFTEIQNKYESTKQAFSQLKEQNVQLRDNLVKAYQDKERRESDNRVLVYPKEE